MDPLADVLEVARVRGALLATVAASAPWGLELMPSDGAALHTVIRGTAWLRLPGHDPVQLMPGDLVMLPTGLAHRLSAAPDSPCRLLDAALKRERMSADGELDLTIGGDVTTTFICAGYDYDHEVGQPLLGLLPPLLHVPADPVTGRALASILDLLAAELGHRAPGSQTSTARLIDLLLVTAIRGWIDRSPADGAPSWLAALHDPVIARVLSLLHQQPAEPWTMDTLARAVHLSRATLARRFTAAVGQAPLSYLTQWRMELAARRLRTTVDTAEDIARDVGYTSAYAFNRAFRRLRGVPPGRYRHAQQASPRQASRPSRIATAAITSAASGSAHDQPNRPFSASPTRSTADR